MKIEIDLLQETWEALMAAQGAYEALEALILDDPHLAKILPGVPGAKRKNQAVMAKVRAALEDTKTRSGLA